MSISMYAASIPVFKHMLHQLAHILDKAAHHAQERRIDPKVFLTARLFPDMFDLTRQVQIVTDNAKGCAARLAGLEVPKFEDNETSFAELQARIARTIAFIETIRPDQIDDSASRDISFQIHERKLEFKGLAYLLYWTLPNFYFHHVTVYNILRHNGVDVGKSDYLGS